MLNIHQNSNPENVLRNLTSQNQREKMQNREKFIKRKRRKKEKLKRELKKLKSCVSFLGLSSLAFFKKFKIVIPQFSFLLNYKNLFIAFHFNYSRCHIYYPLSIGDSIDSHPILRKFLSNYELIRNSHQDNDNSLEFVIKYLQSD